MIEAVRYPDKAYSKLLINRVSKQYEVHAPTLYGKIQAVLDYISGMTDVYASIFTEKSTETVYRLFNFTQIRSRKTKPVTTAPDQKGQADITGFIYLAFRIIQVF